MPWMPNGRAGCRGPNLGGGGTCKHMQTSPELMLGTLTRCWAQLAGLLGGEKTNLRSIIIIKISPAFSLAIGGRDGMDWGGGHWMTCSIISTRHQ